MEMTNFNFPKKFPIQRIIKYIVLTVHKRKKQYLLIKLSAILGSHGNMMTSQKNILEITDLELCLKYRQGDLF